MIAGNMVPGLARFCPGCPGWFVRISRQDYCSASCRRRAYRIAQGGSYRKFRARYMRDWRKRQKDKRASVSDRLLSAIR